MYWTLLRHTYFAQFAAGTSSAEGSWSVSDSISHSSTIMCSSWVNHTGADEYPDEISSGCGLAISVGGPTSSDFRIDS